MSGDSQPAQMIHNLADLLRATGYSSIEELSGWVDESTELDGSLRELSPEDGDGVEILVNVIGLYLLFPFTVDEFWEAVDQVEEQMSDLLGAEALEEAAHDGLDDP